MTYQFLFAYTTPAALQYSDQVETYLMDSMFAKLGLSIASEIAPATTAPYPDDLLWSGGPSHNEGIFDHYERGMALYVSTNADWPLPLQNASYVRERIVDNSADVVLLEAVDWPGCMESEIPARNYVDAAEKYGDCYVFDLRVPAYPASDTSCDDPSLCSVAVVGDVGDVGDVLHAAPKLGNALPSDPQGTTASAGHIVLLVHASKEQKTFVTCHTFAGFLEELGKLN